MGKERAVRHMTARTFVKDQDELRRIWSRQDTRKAPLQGLSEKGYGAPRLAKVETAIDAENSDIFDVLVYLAFTRSPKTRQERGRSAVASFEDDTESFSSRDEPIPGAAGVPHAAARALARIPIISTFRCRCRFLGRLWRRVSTSFSSFPQVRDYQHSEGAGKIYGKNKCNVIMSETPS